MYNPKKLEAGVRLVINEDPQLAIAMADHKKSLAEKVAAASKKRDAPEADSAEGALSVNIDTIICHYIAHPI